MSQNTFKDQLASAFQLHEKNTVNDSNHLIQSIRRSAFESFSKAALPTKKDESWKYTNLDSLYSKTFSVTDQSLNSVSETQISPFLIPNLNVSRLVFVNGIFSSTLSDFKSLAGLAEVFSLSEAIKTNRDEITHILSKKSDNDHHVFTDLNSAFLNDGIFLRVNNGKIIEHPIHILYVSDNQSDNKMIQPRNIIIGGKSSEATIIEHYLSLQNQSEYLTNSVTDIFAEENAVVHHVKIQQESESAFHIGSVELHLEASGTINTHFFSLGSSLIRNNVTANLNAENANVVLNGLYLTAQSQHVDNHTVINHFKPNCSSVEVYKGILDDQSTGVFDGKIVVHKDAQKTNANQSNKNLLLSNLAHADAKPQLEIYADDVKCFHGATVGQLDETQLFYLKSRGIGHDFAKAILTHAFAVDVLNSVKIPELLNYLDQLIMEKLHSPIQFDN